MNKVNSIIFYGTDFKTEDKLLEAVNKQINLLLKSGNVCVVVKSSAKDAVCINYTSGDIFKGEPIPYFLTLDEASYVIPYHLKKEIDKKEEELAELQSKLDELESGEEQGEFLDDDKKYTA